MNPAEETIANAMKTTSNSTREAMPNGDSRKPAISMSLRTFFPVDATSLLNIQAISGVNTSADIAATIRSNPSKGKKAAWISPAAWRIAILALVVSITKNQAATGSQYWVVLQGYLAGINCHRL